METIKYNYSLFYANKYDCEWICAILNLREILEIATVNLQKKSSTHKASINSLSIENDRNIMSFMDAETLCAASGTSKAWNGIASSNIFWENLCRKKVIYFHGNFEDFVYIIKNASLGL